MATTERKPRSYFVHYSAAEGKLLLGGVKQSESSRFEELCDAELRAAAVLEFNPDALVEIRHSDKAPEIYRHCAGSVAQAVGGKCFACGTVLRGRGRD